MKHNEYIWKNGIFLKKEKAYLNLYSHSLHYGSAVFEGIRLYSTLKGRAILELTKHIKRFQYSMKVLNMKLSYSIKDLYEAVVNTIKKNHYRSCYIRPLAYYGEGPLDSILPFQHKIELVIMLLPMGHLLSSEYGVNLLVSKYMRIHPNSTICNAKIAGNYVNSILANMECIQKNYDQPILLDYNGNVAEGGTQNIFFIKNNIIYTPTVGNILNGITRNIIIKIAHDHNYVVEEKLFNIEELINADEAFFTGTVAEITPIKSINNKKIGKYKKIGKITKKIKSIFNDIVLGKNSTLDIELTHIN